VGVSILLAGLAPALLGQAPSTPASTLPSAAGQQQVKTHTLAALPAQTAATQPQVTFRDGLLSIRAENSTLGDVLKAVQSATGASIDSPGVASERVYVNLGPGGPRDVLASLLNGSRYDYILLGSQQQPNSVARIMLTMRQTSREQPAAPAAAARSAPPPNPVEENDNTDTTHDREASAQPVQPIQPNQPVQPVPGQPSPNAPNQQMPGQPVSGQQPKTPEQLLRDLQQLQQQQQQQFQLQQQLQQQNNFGR